MPRSITLIASGDLRLAANQVCWPAQQQVEAAVSKAIESLGYTVKRGHPYMADKKHGFIDSQKYGMEVFREYRLERSADGRRSGLAIQPSCAARPAVLIKAPFSQSRTGAVNGPVWWAC